MKATPEQLAEKFKIEELQERLEFNMAPGQDDWYDGCTTQTVKDSNGNIIAQQTTCHDW